MAEFASQPARLQWLRGIAVCAVIAIVCLPTFSSGVASASETSATGAVKHGDEIFHTKCIICHNKQPDDTSPFGPPNLYQAFKTKAITTAQAEEIITHGKGQMPAFGTTLSKSDMQSVIAYLKTGK